MLASYISTEFRQINSNMKSLVMKPNLIEEIEKNNVLLVDIIQHFLFCKREDDT